MRQLRVPGLWEADLSPHHDKRGVFVEWFRVSDLRAVTSRRFDLVQASCSVSRKGVIRGVHFTEVPPGQAKYVTCVSGEILDIVVDLRVGSATFGTWEKVRMNAEDWRGLYVAEGLGHAFMALTENATVVYLSSSAYDPARDHAIDPLDPELGLPWPRDLEWTMSPRDAAAPRLREARAEGLLPSLATVESTLSVGARDGSATSR